MSKFKQAAAEKGYSPKDLEEVFDVQWRQVNRIMADPKRKHWLALDGLPKRKKK